MSKAKQVGGSTPGNEDPSTNGITQDTAFETLSSTRRRHVLHYLRREERPVSLRELSTQIAAWENDTVPEAVTYKERMRVYTALRQSHLPKMAEQNVVSFDKDRGMIELTEEASELEVYLDIVPHDTIPWSKYYAGLGALSLGFVLANWVGLFPFSLVPGLGVAGVVSLLFAASAVVHVARDRKMRLGSEGEPPG